MCAHCAARTTPHRLTYIILVVLELCRFVVHSGKTLCLTRDACHSCGLVACELNHSFALVIQTVYGCMGVWSDEGGIRACSRLSGYHCSPVMTSHECVTSPSSLSLMVMSELVLAIDVSVQSVGFGRFYV